MPNDFNLRFWDKPANEAVVQYFNSKFLDHASAQDLLEESQQALKDLKNQVCYKFQEMAQVLIGHSVMNCTNIVKERSCPV